MTVAEFIYELKALDQKALITFSNDEEGNHIAELPGIGKMLTDESGKKFFYMLFPDVHAHPFDPK